MAIGTALSLISLLGSAYGMYGSSQANKEADSMLSGRMNDIQSRFDKEYNTPYLDTDQGMSIMKLLNKNFDKQSKKVDNASAVTGASHEAKIAARGKAQDNFDTSLTRLAGYGTMYKDMKERNYNRSMDQLFGHKLAVQEGKSENFTNLASNAANLGSSGITADAVGGGGGEGFLADILALFGGQGNKGLSYSIE